MISRAPGAGKKGGEWSRTLFNLPAPADRSILRKDAGAVFLLLQGLGDRRAAPAASRPPELIEAKDEKESRQGRGAPTQGRTETGQDETGRGGTEEKKADRDEPRQAGPDPAEEKDRRYGLYQGQAQEHGVEHQDTVQRF